MYQLEGSSNQQKLGYNWIIGQPTKLPQLNVICDWNPSGLGLCAPTYPARSLDRTPGMRIPVDTIAPSCVSLGPPRGAPRTSRSRCDKGCDRVSQDCDGVEGGCHRVWKA